MKLQDLPALRANHRRCRHLRSAAVILLLALIPANTRGQSCCEPQSFRLPSWLR
ncbi:hypothetical protein ABIB25_004223 [Nakamurella sp. UYEF19]